MVVSVAVPVELYALEMVVHDEVDDARDGIRAVDRRRAAGQHFDALDQRRRNGVDVGRPHRRAARGNALAVDQHQRAVEPSSRRLIVEVPVAPLDRLLPWSGAACGNWLRMSAVFVMPCT